MTKRSNRQCTLALYNVVFGAHTDAWRSPSSRAGEAGQLSPLRDVARAAEAAKLDAILFADSLNTDYLRAGQYRAASVYEPISAMGALIGSTDKLGLIGTQSTTWNDPFTVARQLLSLDQLSGGRIGWNVVTSTRGNENFGVEEMPPPALRYQRATEFVEVVKKLWDAWDADAIIDDRERALWVDYDRIREINHAGEFFQVKGPLSVPRSPQGWPVLVQAGSSPDGIELGSSIADVVFTMKPDREFYARYKEKVKQKGRDPEKVKILSGVMPIVGRTQAEAAELAAELESYVVESRGRTGIAATTNIDVSDLELDERIPQERFIDGPERGHVWYSYRELAAEMTLRELIMYSARSGIGHPVLIGTPQSIAETMIEEFESRSCDGYIFTPASVPDGLERIFTLLVPELQERGYFRHEYVGDTLRERSGLTLTDDDVRKVRATYV